MARMGGASGAYAEDVGDCAEEEGSSGIEGLQRGQVIGQSDSAQRGTTHQGSSCG